jgi:hypothetical protein
VSLNFWIFSRLWHFLSATSLIGFFYYLLIFTGFFIIYDNLLKSQRNLTWSFREIEIYSAGSGFRFKPGGNLALT